MTAIGKDGQKGNLGSPYSISNPYKLDENLSEDMLELSIEEQFTAFIEAAHLLDMKVVVEFVFRTASRDSELAVDNPHWFYWIKKNTDNFTSPNFNQTVLNEIKEKICEKNFLHLPTPEFDYINLFSIPPVKVFKENNTLIGELDNGEKVKIPGAFADWPPDDIQPAWSDVTYLKLYDSANFNYMAYNTIRMYDEELALEKYEVKDLWRHIENIVPYYQQKFGIDGVMVDMGHSLPEKLMTNIIKKARDENPNFIFWEENFVPNSNSVKSGYDAVIGYLPFDEHDYYKIQNIINTLEKKEFPILCFATSETHNTPRTASRNHDGAYSELIHAINSLLPLPLFIHSGFELCETFPVNTGLGFENIDISKYTEDKLALFSVAALDWLSQNNIITAIIKLNKIKQNYFNITTNNIKLLDSKHENILFFSREDKHKNNIYFIGNFSDIKREIKLEILDKSEKLRDIFTRQEFGTNIKTLLELAPEPELKPKLTLALDLELAAWSYKILI